MFPISDDNPTLRTPVMTYLTLGAIALVWIFFQGAGLNAVAMAASVCNWGMVPGELTGLARLGLPVPIGEGLACVVDREAINVLTPVTSMFLHGGWGHILGNCLFLWVFGNNVEDSMGRRRFVVFYLLCGLVAAGAHVLVGPSSPVPTVGASGAISGVLGAYLVLYPRVRVNLLIPIFFFLHIISVPAWVVLIYWFVLQVITGLPQLNQLNPEVSGGVAVWAHIGGFVAGAVLIKLFENRRFTQQRTTWRHRLHPDHP
ncbi:rhomboid family intramembrane serine protease [Hyalangium rubrum]|uniref:Rhomboid family intramembrane serine protease n=1 Tax=Hyalangium rubrum TaxID=3103134 RepID=A0ABU5GYC3_9BACT|nr:rhomboid family intramembrane serine protease [Hyalangium sp. s54d21]MDY7225879.1 rhomboid family intramembrane serine protease [Hyalangium sp. s54d21]